MTPSGSSQAHTEHTARLLLQSFSRGKAAEVIRTVTQAGGPGGRGSLLTASGEAQGRLLGSWLCSCFLIYLLVVYFSTCTLYCNKKFTGTINNRQINP